jgi:ABC-type phosphate transport system substrate-binding protein
MYKRLALYPLIAGALCNFAVAGTLKVNGSTTVNLPVAEAAEILRAEKKMEIQVDTQGGSSGGISMLGDGLVHVGMISNRSLPIRRTTTAPVPRADSCGKTGDHPDG